MRPVLGIGALAALAVFVLAGGAAARSGAGPVLKLTVKSGGQVSTSDGRLRCRNHCSARYRPGRVLTLTAKPDPNFLFDRWEGACIGAAPVCELAVDRTASVRARFVGVPTPLTVSVGGPGRIRLKGRAGLDCGKESARCKVELPYGSKVTLVPVPVSDGRFQGWDGPCSTAGPGPCTLHVQSPRTEVAASFGHTSSQPGPQTLTVHVGSSAHVMSQPPGIECSGTCSASFPSGTAVTLTKIGGVWGPVCTGYLFFDRCQVVVDAPTDVVIGQYIPPPPPPRIPVGELRVTVSGGGLIGASDADISCGWRPQVTNRCSALIRPIGTPHRPDVSTRHLRARPNARVRFVRWGGVCRGSRRTCTVSIVRKPNEFLTTASATALFRRR